MRSRFVRLLIVALTSVTSALMAVVFTAAPATAGHSWNGYHWSANSYPLDLNPINSLGPSFRDQGVATDVIADWNRSVKFANDQRFGDNDAGTRQNCPYPSGKSFRMCNYNHGANGWAGLAQIHLSGNHIVDGRARVNDYYGTGYNYRRHVLCQEVGHVLGLDHQANGNPSCMDDSSAGWDNLRPNDHDYEQLLRIYDHHHSPPPATTAERAAGPSHADVHLPVEYSVTRLANGDLLVTYVLRPPPGR